MLVSYIPFKQNNQTFYLAKVNVDFIKNTTVFKIDEDKYITFKKYIHFILHGSINETIDQEKQRKELLNKLNKLTKKNVENNFSLHSTIPSILYYDGLYGNYSKESIFKYENTHPNKLELPDNKTTLVCVTQPLYLIGLVMSKDKNFEFPINIFFQSDVKDEFNSEIDKYSKK